uniref:Uncharacterized protein n=1 Tax=Syphacia muris TaxID=451379 RepID=A0A0N5ARX9_9BILA
MNLNKCEFFEAVLNSIKSVEENKIIEGNWIRKLSLLLGIFGLFFFLEYFGNWRLSGGNGSGSGSSGGSGDGGGGATCYFLNATAL